MVVRVLITVKSNLMVITNQLHCNSCRIHQGSLIDGGGMSGCEVRGLEQTLNHADTGHAVTASLIVSATGALLLLYDPLFVLFTTMHTLDLVKLSITTI
jgi:hypothetical protein